MSKSLSTPTTIAMPSKGSPTCVRTIPNIIMPTPGTPAVPIDASAAVKIMTSNLQEINQHYRCLL